MVGLTPQYQSIYRSLDGGATWEQASTPSLLPQDVPGCANSTEWVIYGSGAVGPDGTVFQVLRRCTKLAVAVSADEAKTWTIREVPGSSLPPFDTSDLLQIIANPNILVTELLTVDSAGNVYVIWGDDKDSMQYAVSKDKGVTWSAPVAVAAPEVKIVRYGAVAAKEPGTLAMVYYGSSDGGVKYNGYLAETTNALDPEPSFWSVMVNNPAEPLFPLGFEVGYLGILRGNDLNEIIQVKYAPNGDLWASFVMDMCKSTNASRCDWDVAAHTNTLFQGAVARAVHGVSDSWTAAKPRAADPPNTCTKSDTAAVHKCEQTASTYVECPELVACACGGCLCTVDPCLADEDCRNVLVCAIDTNCRGMDCLLGCNDVALDSGEMKTTMALRIASCASQNSCPTMCM
jgi:hypothetical protein